MSTSLPKMPRNTAHAHCCVQFKWDQKLKAFLSHRANKYKFNGLKNLVLEERSMCTVLQNRHYLKIYSMCCFNRDCSQFEFLTCDESNKRKLVQVTNQNPSASEVKTCWRSQCPIYVRPQYALPVSTSTVSSFWKNIQFPSIHFLLLQFVCIHNVYWCLDILSSSHKSGDFLL